MYCSKCGHEIYSNFCPNCGHPVDKQKSSRNVSPEETKVTVKYSDKTVNILGKVASSLILAILIGFLSYPINKQILGVDKENLTVDDFHFQMRVDEDNVKLRKMMLTEKALDYSKIVGGISFLLIMAFKFINVKKIETISESTRDSNSI